MNNSIFVFIICMGLIISSCVEAVSISAMKKYPYPLLTEDYGILTDTDLAAYTWGLKPRPFTPNEISGAYLYWQCFPREKISIALEDTGYSSEDIGWKDNYGELRIRVQINRNLAHLYFMRRNLAVKDFQKRFNLWRKIMKDQKYVCLAGEFSDRERKVENNTFNEIYSWTFEKIKTKKGCDSYFYSCHPSYKDFLREQAKHNKWKLARKQTMHNVNKID